MFFRGPENKHILKRGRCRDSGIVSISSTSQSQDYMALRCLRVLLVSISTLSAHRRCDCFLLQFIAGKLKNSKARVGLRWLRARRAACLHLYSVSSHRQTLPPIWVRRVIVTKSSGKKAGWGRMGGGFPKPRGRMAVVPLADPQASPLEADRLTSVRA